jgi:hypothetical protein
LRLFYLLFFLSAALAMHVSQKRTNVSYGNALISDRVQEKAQHVHEESIRRARPIVDCGPPQTGKSLATYGKDFIYKKKVSTINAFNDLKMIQNIARTMTRPFSLPPRAGPVSLNRGNRKRDIERINRENAKILHRLETLKPQISANQHLKDYDRAQRYMVNASYSMRKDVEKKLKYQRSLLSPSLDLISTPPLPPNHPAPPQFILSRPEQEEEDHHHQLQHQ